MGSRFLPIVISSDVQAVYGGRTYEWLNLVPLNVFNLVGRCGTVFCLNKFNFFHGFFVIFRL